MTYETLALHATRQMRVRGTTDVPTRIYIICMYVCIYIYICIVCEFAHSCATHVAHAAYSSVYIYIHIPVDFPPLGKVQEYEYIYI